MAFDFNNASLMLIGRDGDMLALLREVLSDAGFQVGARLLEGFLQQLYTIGPMDLVIYDESYPHVDAEGVYNIMLDVEGWSEVPLMLLSDACDGARIARCLDRGIIEFIAKPFDPDELAARIRKVLREAHDEHDNFEVDGFAGDLAYLGLPDLLINLHQNMRSGELVVTMDEGEYVFQLSRGQLVQTHGPDGMSGIKPLYRAIRLYYGKFIFNPVDDSHTFSDVQDFGPLPNLILSAVQESDEYPLIREKLPGDSIEVTIAQKPGAFSGDMRILKPLIQAPDRITTIDHLIRLSPKSDLDAAKELQSLYEKQVLVIA